jgi:hypothetical protein
MYISFCRITADKHARKQYMLKHRIDHVHMVVVTVSQHAIIPSLRRKFETSVFFFFLHQRGLMLSCRRVSCVKMPGYYTVFVFLLVLCNNSWLIFIYFIFYFPLSQPPAFHKNIRIASVLELIEFNGALFMQHRSSAHVHLNDMQCAEFWCVPSVIALLLYKAYCSAENMNIPLFFPNAGEWENITCSAILYFVRHCLIVKWHLLLLGA